MVELFLCENFGVFGYMISCSSIGVPQRVFYGGKSTKNGRYRILIKGRSILWYVYIKGGGDRRIAMMPTRFCYMIRFVTNLVKLFDRLPRISYLGRGADVRMRTRKPRRMKKRTELIVWASSTRSVIGEFLFVLRFEMPWSRYSVNLKNRVLSQLVFAKPFFLR